MRKFVKNLVYGLSAGRLIRRGAPGAVYLTYDDGPHPGNTTKILEVLSRYKAKATFFMIGASMEEYPEIVNAVIEGGHSIGFHSHRHDSVKDIKFTVFREDLAHARSLSKRFNYPIRLYRPPFGDLSLATYLFLLFGGWKIIMWSLDCGDSYDSLSEILQNLDVDTLSDGEIILLHEDYDEATNLLETILQRFSVAGLKCQQL